MVAPETDKSIPLIRPTSNYTARVNDCLGRDILSARQMALRAAVLYLPLQYEKSLLSPSRARLGQLIAANFPLA